MDKATNGLASPSAVLLLSVAIGSKNKIVMTIKNKTISKGFVLAGLMNILGVLVNSRFFTNVVIPQTDPVIMSNFGLLMIIIWGLAYIAVSKKYEF